MDVALQDATPVFAGRGARRPRSGGGQGGGFVSGGKVMVSAAWVLPVLAVWPLLYGPYSIV